VESFAHCSSPFVEIFDFHGNGIGHAGNVVDAKPAGNQRDFRGSLKRTLLSQTKDKKPPISDGWFFIKLF